MPPDSMSLGNLERCCAGLLGWDGPPGNAGLVGVSAGTPQNSAGRGMVPETPGGEESDELQV